MNAKSAIRNKTWAELNVGDAASLERDCSAQDRLASCALALLYEYWRREGRAFADQSTGAKAAE